MKPEPGSAKPAGASFRLLVVEDDLGHAALLERTLRRGGVENELVLLEDGGRALDFLRAREDSRPDLMLLDLRLPRLDGMGLLRELRADPLLVDLPVIVTSTTLDPREEEACHALGCQCFLLKPVRLEGFLEALGRLEMLHMLEGALAVEGGQGRSPETRLQ